MPLLHIVGMTATNQTFTLAFCFLSKETKEDYLWSLQQLNITLGNVAPAVTVTDRELALLKAIETVWPSTHSLVCLWHVNKNVTAQLTKFFAGKDASESLQALLADWHKTISQPSRLQFQESWELLCHDYSRLFPEAIRYLETWLPFAPRFAAAFVNKITHFNSASSSRVEGAHRTLKRWLGVCSHHLRL